eukprot:TRINITY_DN5666_c0_g1_i4.p1 TRINITY_DN5666_c0_g1~~TRINITY_DN5666_c0_g1_i4.p1  ORF type:complete len:107 (-),score=11.99 TRINITY_DN5666_c0_g1_i4:606-926(-)
MEPHKNLKVIVIGDSGVGKTLLVQREIYKNGGMRINGIRGLDCHTIEVIHDGCVYQFQIWDTAGQERFAFVQHTFMKKKYFRLSSQKNNGLSHQNLLNSVIFRTVS